MDDHDWLAERFEAHRTHLRAVAYRGGQVIEARSVSGFPSGSLITAGCGSSWSIGSRIGGSCG